MLFFAFPSFAQDFTAKTLGDYGNVTVMEAAENYDAKNPDGTNNVAPRQVIAKEFFKTHKDEYDFLVIFTNYDFKMPESEARAFYTAIKNDVRGIGQQVFDNSALYGSNGKLQGTIDMGNIASNVSDPLNPGYELTLETLSHEMLHRWGAYVHFKDAAGKPSTALLGKDGAHWSYLLDTKGSVQYGNQWLDNGDGAFTSGNAHKYYSALDRYLMGMIDKSQVPPMLLIINPAIDPAKLPDSGLTISGTPSYVTIDNIIAAEGERVPSSKDAPKQFKMAFIFVTTPGTFTGQELYGIESIRNGFLPHYSILTDGQGLVQVALTPKENQPVNPGVHPPATDPRTLPPNIDDGIKWLISSQQGDGSWADFNLTTERDSAEAVTTLQSFPIAQQQFQAGLAWLGSNASSNTDFLARRIEASIQAGTDSSALVQDLLNRRNPDGGWGSGRNFISNPTDTALALRALSRAGYRDGQTISQAIAFLQAAQDSDGGWSGSDTVSTIQPTATVVSAFNVYRQSYALDATLNRAVAFLTGKQNPDGGFGNSPSTVYDSAVAVTALQEVGADRGVIGNGVNYLMGAQGEDGSWNESPYQTALAVRAVWEANVDPDLSIKADYITFIPDKVTTLPTTEVVNAVVWNVGRTDVAQAKVALYDGTIFPEKKVAEQTLAFPALSPVTVTFTVPVTDGNEHVYNVVVDPDNLIKESNKNNNSAVKALLPEPTYDFEVLAADLSVSPNPVDMGRDVTITAKVSNRGTSDAYNAPVRFYIDDPAAPIDIATITVDIPAGRSVTNGVTWKTSKAGANMPLTVMADPLNAFAETNKGNNRAVVQVTVNSPPSLPNLAVLYRDIVVTPAPASQGGNAHISIQAKNTGFAPAANVKVYFYNGAPDHGGVLLGSQILPAVNPGDSIATSIDWLNIGEPGGKIVYVRVDPDNTIQEISKDDNDAFTTLTVLSLPDLTISSSSVVLTPAVPKDGDTVAIAVTVQNTGEQEAANIAVQVAERGTVIGTATIPLIKGHSQATASIPYNATAQTGSHSITVTVDPGNTITEQSKDNNAAVRGFGVQNANLWLSEPYFSPNGDGVKDTTQFSFRLDSPAAVKIVVTDKNGNLVRTFSGGDLDNTQGSIVTWDGKNDNGMVVGDGAYQFRVVDTSKTVLGSLPVVLDTNRAPITDAVGTKFSQITNLFGRLPNIMKWQWLPDESGIPFYIDGNTEYPGGLYVMGPDGSDVVSLTPLGWSEDPLYDYSGFQDYKISPDGEKIAFVLHKQYINRKATSFTDTEQLVIVDLNTYDTTIVDSNDELWQQRWQGSYWGWQPTVVQDYYFIPYFEWSPKGEKILYGKTLQTVNTQSSDNGQSTSWIYDCNNGNKSLVLTTYTPVRHLLSPDGANLVYYRDSTYYNAYYTNSYLGIVNLDNVTNTNIENISTNYGIDNIIWSDSGFKFAYIVSSYTNGTNTYVLKVSDINGTVRSVYSSALAAGQNHSLQWVANDKITITEDDWDSAWGGGSFIKATRLYLIDANVNGMIVKLAEVRRGFWQGGYLYGGPGWYEGPYISPDKQSVAFAVSEDGYTTILKVSDLAGNVSTLYSLKTNDSSPKYYPKFNSLTWSPDNSKIAFSIMRWALGYWGWALDTPQAAIADIASGKLTFFNAHESAVFKWQPDNLSVIGASESVNIYPGLTMYNAITGEAVRLLNGEESVDNFSVSPLNTYLTYEVLGVNGIKTNLQSLSFLNNLTAELRITTTNSALTLKGTAQDLNFEGYKLEYAEVKNPDAWNLMVPPSDVPVVNDVFATWVPPGNGNYYVRLTVSDKAGNTVTSKKRVSWGSASTTITSLYKTTDFISPNGDGGKDTVEFHYRILAPIHLEFNVYDEANNLVRTFDKDYASPVDDYISWDGRDLADNVVPDGKYTIKVLDYEFFVEVDTAPPQVNATLSPISFDTANNNFYVDFSALAYDKNLKSWKIEYGEGDNPQEWHDYSSGSDVLVNKDNNGNMLSPSQNALVQKYRANTTANEIVWLKGKKFRITAEDFAGNKSSFITGLVEEKVLLGWWDSFVIPGNTILPGFANNISGFETLHQQAANIVMQYWDGTQWHDTTSAPVSATGVINTSWGSANVAQGAAYGVRAKVVDSLGGEHYSNVAQNMNMFTTYLACPDIKGTNALFENIALLKFQVKSSDDSNYSQWTDYKVSDASKGDTIPRGDFILLLPDIPGIKPDRHYQFKMIGTGMSGAIYTSDVTTYAGDCTNKSLVGEFLLKVTHDEAKGCGEVAPGNVRLDAQYPANVAGDVSFQALSYFIQKSDGLKLLHTYDLLREGWNSFLLPTSDLPEGAYPIKAVLSYLYHDDNRVKQVDASATLKVDRALPTSRITYPAGDSLKLCPIKTAGPGSDWFGIPVEAVVADNIGIKRYELSYGSGGDPAAWLPATAPALDHGAVVNRQISGNGPVQGSIGAWNLAGLSGGTYSLRLKVVDTSGNVSCSTASVSFDNPVGIPMVTGDKPLISPNGDGIADDVSVNFQIDRYATVDAKVFRLLDNGSLDTSPVRALVSAKTYLAGLGSLAWDGKSDAGAQVPDARYGMAIFATDSCGNTTMKWAPVEVDGTPPTVAINYPMPADPLPPGNIIEVKGTAGDAHFQSYTLEAGQGDSPASWVTVAGGTSQVNGAIIGAWNGFGLPGRWTLRLSAVDRVGNKSSTTSTVDLGTRQTLVKSLVVTPKLFSPNNDNKVDTTLVTYEITDACQVKIEIVDAGGTTVKSPAVNTASAGAFSYLWDGKNNAGVTVQDGSYLVKLTAALTANPSVTQTESFTVTVDTTSPAIDIKQPVDKSFLNVTSLDVAGTISDPNLPSYTVNVTGAAGQVLQDSGNQNRSGYLFGTIKDIAEGDYTLSAQAKDLGENATMVTRAFTIDRTPPKVTLDTPKDGAYYGSANNVINVAGSLIEKNLDRFSLRYGTGEAPTAWQELVGGNTLPVSPNLFTWTVGKNGGVPDGLYTLSFYAKDKAGLEGEARVKVVVDNTPPAVAFASLHNSDYVKGPIDLIGDLDDANLDSGVLELAEGSCAVAAKWSPLRNYRASVSGGVLESWKILPADGDYCLRMSAVDKSGNKASAMVSVKIATHPPAAPVLSGKIDGRTNVILNWSGNSEPDLAGYNVYRDGQKLNSAPLTDITYTDGGLKDGTYTYTVKALNQAGNESSASNAVKLRIDTIGPDAWIIYPQNGAKVNDLFNVKGTAFSADDFKEYRIFFGQGQTPAAWNLIRRSPLILSGATLAQWDTSVLPDGIYSLKLEAEDLSGNVTVQTISVTVDNTLPAAPVLLSVNSASADVTITWRANTEPDLAGYLLYRNDQLANGSGLTGNFKPYLITGTTFVDKALPDGKYTYYLVAVDQVGNIGNISNSMAVTIDMRPPHTTITDPANNGKFEQKIMLKADSVDNDAASVQFQYKRAQDSAWANLGASVTNKPFVNYLDPKALGFSYGDYQLMAIATDNGGKTDPAPSSITVTYADLTPPAIPLNLQAATSGSTVNLSWSANTEQDLDGYNIYRTSGTTSTKINSTTIKTAVYQNANISDGTYGYVVTAIDTFGNESKPTSSVSATVYAPQVTQPYTPVSQPAVRITGTNAAPNSSVELIDTTAAGQNSLGRVTADPQGNFVIDNVALSPGVNTMAATATDSAGNTSRVSDAEVVTYGRPPAKPTGVAATVLDYTVSLAWDSNLETDLAGYNVYRDGVKLNVPVPVTTGQASANNNNQAGSAFDGNPATVWFSNYGYGSFPPAWWEADFPAPGLINHLAIHWQHDLSSSYAGKDFEVQAWSGYAWITLTKVTGNTANDNAFDFAPSYPTAKIRISITATNCPSFYKQVGIAEVNILKDAPVSQTAYQDTNLRDGRYHYTVIAVNSSGFESVPSDKVPADVGDVTPPAAPQGLAAVVTGSSVALGWSPNGEPGLAGYNIYRESLNGWQKLNTALVTNASFSDPNLVNGTYSWHVTAVDTVGNESVPSGDVTATVAVTLLPPSGTPRITPVPAGKALDIAWDASGGTTASYTLYRSIAPGGPYQRVVMVSGTTLGYHDPGLVNGTVYYYVVTATDVVGNESAHSREVAGAPADTVVPEKPLILYPVHGGEGAVVYRGSVDVAGTAEPGSTVELFEGGLSVGKTVASPAETMQQVHVDGPGGSAAPSPDGTHIVYTDNSGALIIMDVFSGVAGKIAASGSSPLWSPDGEKVAYQYTDPARNARVGIYDVEAQKSVPLTDDQSGNESMFSWSRDGNKVVYVSNRGNSSNGIWVKDFVAASETQTSLSGNYPKLSPDGKKIAYFSGAMLNVASLDDGTSLPVSGTTDGYTCDWSPDSGKVVYVSNSDGNPNLYAMELATQSRQQVTASTGGKSSPAWSPNGQSVVYGLANAVWLADLHGQTRKLTGAVGLPAALVWGTTGTIAFYDGSTKNIYSDHLAGQFVFKDMEIFPGENLFTVVATDDVGNTSPASDPITVTFDTSLLPDLAASSDDIYIYPLLPKPGEGVTVDAVVTNVSNAPVDNVDVDIYFWDSAGNLQLIGSQTILHLDGKASEDVAVSVNAGLNTGAQTIIVNIDSKNKIKEMLKSNNTATKEFYVTDKEEVTVAATMDSAQYASGQDALVTVVVNNSGNDRDGVLNVTIEDDSGNAVSSLGLIAGAIPYGVNTSTHKWNTGATFAGSYRVHAFFTAADGSVAESRAQFAILPDMSINPRIVTDKEGYGAKEDVAVTVDLKNGGSNYIVSQLKEKIRIVDAGNTILFTEEKDLGSLFPGSGTTLSSLWNTGLNPPGNYRAIVEASIEGNLVSSSTANFAINPISRVSGAISVAPAEISLGSSFKASFTVTNTGNLVTDGTVKAVIADPDNGATFDPAEEAVNLPLRGSLTGEFNFTSQGLQAKRYQVRLQYLSQGALTDIASAGLTVKDLTPPVVTIVSPVAGTTYNAKITIAVHASDATSGVDTVEYQLDGSAWKLLPLADPASGRYATVWNPLSSDNGAHIVSFRATDKATNTSVPVSVPVTFDTQPPVLSVSSLSDGAHTNNSILNIAGMVTDNTGVQGVTVNGTPVAVNSDGSFSYALLFNGVTTVTTIATDLADNHATDIRTITLDQTAPALTITAPDDNIKTDTALLTVTGKVDETSTVLVKLSNNVQTASMDGNTYTATVNLASGYNTIEVTATDLADNHSSQKRTVLYDDKKPSVSITDPGQDIKTNKSSLIVKGTASDPWTAVSLTITMDDQTYSPPVVNGAFEQAVIFTAEKSYAITVEAKNELGTTTSVQRNVIYDSTPPALTINPVVSPTDQTSQSISGTKDASLAVVVTCATASVGSVSYPTDTSWQTTLSGLQQGDNVITVTSTDVAGNVNTATTTIKLVVSQQDVIFSTAVFGANSVTMSGGTLDSYIGSPASYMKGQYVNGDVGTNSLQACAIKLSGGAVIFGKAWVGPGGNPFTEICTSGGSFVYNNNRGSLTKAKDMAPMTDPSGGTSIGALKLSSTTKSLSVGDYRTTSISLSGGSTLNLNGQITLHVDGNVTLSGGSKIVVSSGPVTIYVNGQKMDISGGSIINNSQDPTNLTVYGTAGLQTANLSGGSNLYALVFAPNAAITFSGGGDVFGSIIGKSVVLSGGSSVHYYEYLLNHW